MKDAYRKISFINQEEFRSIFAQNYFQILNEVVMFGRRRFDRFLAAEEEHQLTQGDLHKLMVPSHGVVRLRLAQNSITTYSHLFNTKSPIFYSYYYYAGLDEATFSLEVLIKLPSRSINIEKIALTS